MSSKTLLQIINTCQQELGLPVATTVSGNADATTVQMFAFLNATLDELREYNDEGWVALQTEYNIAVTPPMSTTGNTKQNSPVLTGLSSLTSLLYDSAGNQVFDSFGAPIYTLGNAQTALIPYAMAINGSGIPPAARVISVTGPGTVVMSMEATATATGETIQFAQDTYPMPSDFDFSQNATWWDRTNHWALIGPDSPQIDQWHRSGIVATGPRRHFRQIGPYPNTFRLWPPPFELVDPIQISFEYMSINAVQVNASATNFAQYFVNDADTCLLNDRALIMGIKWRFWEQKGMNWGSKRSDYDQWVDRLVARDGAAQTLSLARNGNSILISPFNTQDGNYPAPTWSISGG